MTTGTPTAKGVQAITIQPVPDELGNVTLIKLHAGVEVYEHDGFLISRDRVREVRVGPFTSEQAELISDDLGYLAVENDEAFLQERRKVRKGRVSVAEAD